MKDFNYWKKLHDSEKLDEFSTDNIGLLWLKTKSVIRKGLIAEFIQKNSIQLTEKSLGKQFIELFTLLSKDPQKSNQQLDTYIKEKNKSLTDGFNTDQLVSELQKMQISVMR